MSGHFLPRPHKVAGGKLNIPYRRGSREDENEPISPYTCVAIHGVEEDNAKQQTRVIKDNGFDPVWDETFVFQISRPDIAILTFQVYDSYCKCKVVTSAFPVNMLREGVRWVPMWDHMLRDLENCGLLVEIRLRLSPSRLFSKSETKKNDLLTPESPPSKPSCTKVDLDAPPKDGENISLQVLGSTES